MAAKRKFSQPDWDSHKATIEHLYYERRLPLISTDGECVTQIMTKDHDFPATSAQYETQLKKWGKSKNLKFEEWDVVLRKLDELSSQGVTARVNISGQIPDEARIKRAKRHVNSKLDKNKRMCNELQTCYKFIEVSGENGIWSPYTELSTRSLQQTSHATTTIPTQMAPDLIQDLTIVPFQGQQIGSGSMNSRFDNASSLQLLGPEVQAREELQTWPRYLPFDSPSLTTALFGDIQFMNTEMSPIGTPLPFSEENMFPRTSPAFFPEEPSIPGLTHWVQDGESSPTLSSDHHPLSRPWDQLVRQPYVQLQITIMNSLCSPRSLIFNSRLQTSHSHLSWATVRALLSVDIEVFVSEFDYYELFIDYFDTPNPRVIIATLKSLLPDTLLQDSQAISLRAKQNIDNHSIYTALLYSVLNNFAGLGGVAPGFILKLLHSQQSLFSHILRSAQQWPTYLSRSLVENLFKAAIVIGDVKITKTILKENCNASSPVNLNDILCNLKNHRWPPLAVAVSLGNFGLVETLLNAKADVAVHVQRQRGPLYRIEDFDILELALSDWTIRDKKPIHRGIVGLLLAHNTKVLPRHILEAFSRGADEIGFELLSKGLAKEHEIYFKDLLPDLYRERLLSGFYSEGPLNFTDDTATKIIQDLLFSCQIRKCYQCHKTYQAELQDALHHAMIRGHRSVIYLLLPRAASLPTFSLAMALRTGDRQLFQLIRELGADIDTPAVNQNGNLSEPRSSLTTSPENCFITPLSEAIRAGDYVLIKEFEDAGALDWLADGYRFQAAFYAAADARNVPYMSKLIRLCRDNPRQISEVLIYAFEVAIQNDDTEAATFSIEAHVENAKFEFFSSAPLLTTIRKRNRPILEILLEFDSRIDDVDLTEAIILEDTDLVKDLMFMMSPAAPKVKALEAAITKGNVSLVKDLVKYGAGPDKIQISDQRRGSVMEVAAEKAGDEMIRLLLSLGADPADEEAFIKVIEQRNQEGLYALMAEYNARYPKGKRGFGWEILSSVIKTNNISLFDRLLTNMRFDMNIMNRQYGETLMGYAIGHNSGQEFNIVLKLLDTGIDIDPIVSWRTPKQTALLMAIKRGHTQLVELLIRKGANVNKPARRGLKRTPLQQACEVGIFEIVKLLLDHGADVHAPAALSGGGTALQLAAISGSLKVVHLLLKLKADVHASPSRIHGRTALQGAAEHGRLDVIMTLWEAGSTEGFPPEDIKSAIEFADANQHYGCAELLRHLSNHSTESLPRVMI